MGGRDRVSRSDTDLRGGVPLVCCRLHGALGRCPLEGFSITAVCARVVESAAMVSRQAKSKVQLVRGPSDANCCEQRSCEIPPARHVSSWQGRSVVKEHLEAAPILPLILVDHRSRGIWRRCAKPQLLSKHALTLGDGAYAAGLHTGPAGDSFPARFRSCGG
jgi:hypothetical protein